MNRIYTPVQEQQTIDNGTNSSRSSNTMTMSKPAKVLSLASALATFLASSSPASAQAQPATPPAPPAATDKPAAVPEEKPPAWETSASLGLTLTRGNSKTLLATANILSERKWDHNELRLGADAAYGEDHDVKNTESLHGFGQYNRLITD